MNLTKYLITLLSRISHPLVIGMNTFLISTSILANPVLDNVAAGLVNIQQTPNSTVVNQSSQQAIINWQSFNIGASETTYFQQPAGGVALNRINPSNGVSAIYGRLTATGQIILVNPAGLFFGPGSFVNVGGLIATTANITDQDFLNGYYHFANNPNFNGAVVNQGQIIAADHGLVALIGGAVSNEGMIQANMGHAVLASGDAFTMTFAGNNLIGFSVDSGVTQRGVDKDGNTLANGVNSTGSIIANGGNILISAKDAAGVLDNVINMSGIARAMSVDDGVNKNDGEIILWGDPDGGVIRVAGELASDGGTIIVKGYNLLVENGASFDVSSVLHDGGFIETSGTNGLMLGNLSIDTSSQYGKAGTWLIDPADLVITTANSNITSSTPFQPTATVATLDVNTLTTALASGNVTVQTNNDGFTGSGNITVATGITWTSANTLLLQSFNNIIINAPISGVNGSLNLDAVNAAASITTGANGTIDVANFNLLQGQWYQVGTLPAFNVRNNFQINSGNTPNASTQFIRAINPSVVNIGMPSNPYQLVDIYGFQGISSNLTTLAQNYELSSNIDATSTVNWNGGAGFVRIGYTNNPTGVQGTEFTGSLEGNNFSISNLYMNINTAIIQDSTYAMFGAITGATLQNLVMINPNITVTNSAMTDGNVGTLVGATIFGNTVTNIDIVGGTVIGTNVKRVGGFSSLVQPGTIITNSSSSADVIYNITLAGLGVGQVGGFIGGLSGSANTSYSSGDVTINALVAGASSQEVGGFAGILVTGTLTNVYSLGNISALGANISAGSKIGGLVGNSTNVGASVINSYSTGAVSASAGTLGGLIGRKDGSTTVTNSYWDTETSGQSSSDGGTGLTTAQTMQSANFNTWSFGATAPVAGSGTPGGTWLVVNGATRPMLSSEWSTEVSTPHQVALMNFALGATYNLSNDINLSSMLTNTSEVFATNYNTATGAGFYPLGGAGAFTGTLNGQGNTISNLYIYRPASNNVGLFGQLNGSANINNLALTGVNVSGAGLVGGLSGRKDGGVIHNVSVTGNITGTTNYIGGLTGYNTTNITGNTFVMGNVTATGTGSYVGGLIGMNFGNITGTTVGDIYYGGGTVHASGAGGSLVGGLIGWNRGGVTSNAATLASATVTALSQAYVGGLIGQNDTAVVSSSSAATVNGGNYVTGGLIGFNYGSITGNTFATGNVTGTQFVGGLMGVNQGANITPANLGEIYATGNVTGTFAVGGLIGESYRALSNVSYTNYTGGVTAPGAQYVGGLVALSYSTISNSFADVSGASIIGGSKVGGLVGVSGSTLSGNSYATGNVYGTGSEIGGLIGHNYGAITATAQGQIYASGSVTGSGSGNYVGGLIGYNDTGGALTNVVAMNPTVNAPNKSYVGGITGYSRNSISNSYSTGNITGLNQVGGISGMSNTATAITASYNTGNVTGNTNVGGIIGNTTSTTILTDVYSNAAIIGVTNVGGLIGQHAGTLSATSPGLSYASGSVTGSGVVGAIVANQLTGSTLSNTSVGNLTLQGLASNTEFSLGKIDAIDGTLQIIGTGNATLDLSSFLNQTINIALTGTNSGTAITSGNTGSIAFNQFENITSSNGDDTLRISGGTLAGNYDAGAGTNLIIADNALNEWNINAMNSGTVTGITGTFTNVQTLMGGSGTDIFRLTGGSLSGTLNGGAGTNYLYADNGANNWQITADNSGTVNGVMAGFSNIQHLMGGTGVDVFDFTQGTRISGSVQGGDMIMNYINFTLFTSILTLTLDYPIASILDAGVVRYQDQSTLTRFSAIQQSTGNSIGNIIIPNKPGITVTFYDKTFRNGEIGDPFYFNEWNIANPTLQSIGATIAAPVAGIVNQPQTNTEDNNGTETYTGYTHYDPTVVNKTYIDPLLNTTTLQSGTACYQNTM